MGRYSWGWHSTVESTHALGIDWLMKSGKHKTGSQYHNHTVTWTTSGAWGEKKNSITYDLDLASSHPEITLRYVLTDNNTGEETHVNYQASLVTTPCNLGGSRYWFICPGNNCGRRVGKLYFGSKYMLCRHCQQLTYQSRNTNQRFRLLGKIFDFEDKQEKAWNNLKRKFYKGKPTRKYRRILNMDMNLSYEERVRVMNGEMF